MKIIMLKDVAKVGRKYETKDVAEGYALNLLIPKGLAIAATPDAVKRIGIEILKDEGEKRLHQELLMKNLKELDGVTVTMKEKANDKGHLFAGVHKAELIPEIQKQTRIQVDESHIVLDKPIKEIGKHEIVIKVGDKKASFTLDIVKA